jgi:hypothetical protein
MLLLTLLLMLLFKSAPPPIKFIHPRPTVYVAQMRGTEIQMQVMLKLEPEDRWLDVDLLQGGLRVGGFGKELEGTDSDSIQPFFKPHSEKHGPGKYVIVARICRAKDIIENRTACRDQRAMLAKEILICGGEDACN